MLAFSQVYYLYKRGIFSHNNNSQNMDTSMTFQLKLKVTARALATSYENKRVLPCQQRDLQIHKFKQLIYVLWEFA